MLIKEYIELWLFLDYNEISFLAKKYNFEHLKNLKWSCNSTQCVCCSSFSMPDRTAAARINFDAVVSYFPTIILIILSFFLKLFSLQIFLKLLLHYHIFYWNRGSFNDFLSIQSLVYQAKQQIIISSKMIRGFVKSNNRINGPIDLFQTSQSKQH